ncbi:MAG: UDP-3-O-acyl-N-acetylglucosamine deacetylase [Neomegalonema sp.]|nr:UDP-3-O-acyl-N-acetylglucosamine deacetylase [Neomegalonema sp.]
MQATLSRAVRFEGVGVHGGQRAVAVISPAPAGSGIRFIRTDIVDRPNVIAARYDAVADTRLCTVLANEAGATVSTIEHLMAALAGVGVTNATVWIDGPEVPIMDGSSAPFVREMAKAGLKIQKAFRRALKIVKTVTVTKDDKQVTLSPARWFEMSFEIDFAEPAIGRQRREMAMVNGVFIDELSRARTFGRLADAERLRAAGLGRGASLENAIVVDGERVLNRGGLRYADEFVRHKMLDAVGDLALAGAPIIGRYVGVKAGHEMTNLALRALFKDDTAYRWVDYNHQREPKALGMCFDEVAA